jgi:CBS domain-containing protein
MLVRDLMSAEVVTIDIANSLRAAAKLMLSARVGSVIVTEDGNRVGILTENDALAAGCVADVPFDEIPVSEAMSRPLVTIQPDKTVRAAVERMEAEDVKKLPVVDGMDLLGIVTMSDVVKGYQEIMQEAHQIDDRRDGWESKRLSESDISDLP